MKKGRGSECQNVDMIVIIANNEERVHRQGLVCPGGEPVVVAPRGYWSPIQESNLCVCRCCWHSTTWQAAALPLS